MRKILVALVLVAVVAIGLYFAFGRNGADGPVAGLTLAPGDADAPLAYVPADTPFVIANLEPLPKASLDAWMQQSETAIQVWRLQYDVALQSLMETHPDGAEVKWARALEAEFRGKTLTQSLETLGIDLQSRSAFYGVGLVPVIRMSLGNPDAFRAFVGRVETAAGEKIPAAKVGDVDYWQFTADDAPLRGILALQGKHLVATLAPVNDDTALRALLGVDKPAASMRDGAPLAKINAQYGYTPFATGYVDTARVVALLTAPATPIETAFLTALDVQKPTVDAVCQVEYAALALAVPRLVVGYTVLEPKRSVGVSRIELRSDIAKDLVTLRAPMPGLDAAKDAAMNLGFSLKLAQVPPLVAKWADTVKASPWQCASLAELNTAFEEGSAQLTNPAVFMAGPVFEGFHGILTRFSMPTAGEEPDFAGKLLIGSPSPTALLSLATSFVPQVAELNLQPDGVVKAVPAMPGMPTTQPAHVAMTDKMLGIALGAGEEATLTQAMTVDPVQQPLFVIGYSGQAFLQFSEQMTASMAAIEDPAKRAESERSLAMIRQLYGMIKRIDMRVEFDETGVVFHQSAEMN